MVPIMTTRPLTIALLLASVLTAPAVALSAGPDDVFVGVALAGGGRYDDVRMCVGSPAGVKGGPAMDVSLLVEVSTGPLVSVAVNVPVVRPVLFAAAFRMLQFEPDVRVLFRPVRGEKAHLVLGPTLGITLHWGPDYRSKETGPGRSRSFFALGPTLGAWIGIDIPRPGKKFNFQIGIHPYATALFGIGDPDDHRGWVAGGMLVGIFRFHATPHG